MNIDKAVKEFMNGGAMPRIVLQGEAKSVDGKVKIVLTKEVYDREGELIDIDGMDIENFLKNPVMLDAHQMNGSVVETVLGRILNIQKVKDAAGVKMLVGEPEFAPSPKGQIAKILVENGFVKTVSVGFGVKDYDHETRRIVASELYEVSLVSVPANTMATIGKSLKVDEDNVAEKLEVTLKNYKEIHTKIKQYRALFMSDEMFTRADLTKEGDELLDIKKLYDTILLRLKTETPEQPVQEEKAETPPPSKENEPETFTVTKDELVRLIREVIEDNL